ncbi:GTP-binding protein Rhes-like [Portunus trituberculatus]|uniref:GTP-binding protein Rhes-like n=1 Tax=Portunus trituberculatus TaxID=210409 RepID=UPI001E1D1EE3|nr:GTP-binding protein Rhes-like [Portunus trituberculatus]
METIAEHSLQSPRQEGRGAARDTAHERDTAEDTRISQTNQEKDREDRQEGQKISVLPTIPSCDDDGGGEEGEGGGGEEGEGGERDEDKEIQNTSTSSTSAEEHVSSPSSSDTAQASSSGCSKGATPPTSLPLVPKSNMKPPAKNCFRLVVLGASKVGKTSIVSRFLNNKFDESYTPTIEDFHRKLYRIRGDVYQLDILDTSGNHPFPAMRRLSFLTGDLFILVFSWDSRDSWNEILRLREQIVETKNCVTSSLSGSRRRLRGGVTRVPMVIAGNKVDKEHRVVTAEEVQKFVASLSCCAYVDASAKMNYNVDKLFYELFVLANLPMEMSPALHKRVCPIQQGQTTASSCPVGIPGSSGRHRGLSIRRRLSDAYGMVAPNVRRPSIRTDLLILRAKTSLHLTGLDTFTEKKPRKEVSCVIQ